MKKLYFTLILVAALAFICGSAAAREIRFGHVGPPFHGQHKGAEAFANYVTEKTGGEISIKVFPMGQLGPEMSMAEQVQSGTLDMAAISSAVLLNFVPEAAVIDLPFVYPNRETAYAVLDDPEFQQKYFSYFPAKGFVAIGFTENEFRDITNSKHPVRKPEDLKGLKLRVMNSPIYMDTFKELGASAIGMPFPQIYSALQQGVIDGQENPAYTSILMKFTEVNKHVTMTQHILTACPIIINADIWESLSPEEQTIFREAAQVCIKENRAVTAAHFKKLPKHDVSIEEFLKQQGVEVVELTAEERAAFVDAVKPVWTKYEKIIGEDLYGFFMKKLDEHKK